MSSRLSDRDGISGKPKLLVCLGAAWPGNDASGPNRSFAGFSATFAKTFDIKLLARSHAFGSASSRPTSRDWSARDTHHVRYLDVGLAGAHGLPAALRETAHDLLLLNGFFDREFTIPILLARALHRMPLKPVILSPRGEFSDGALGLKSGRKAAWLAFVRASGLLRNVVVHATSDAEADDIAAADLRAKTIVVAPNLSPPIVPPLRPPRVDGVLRIAFIGRISPVKNLDFALSVLAGVRAPVHFDILGPVQDEGYAGRCRVLATSLPTNIAVHWHGEVPAQDIPNHLVQSDLLFLPSKSENFGHAIFEAFACGTPVLIGQKTPWRNLAGDGAGFDLPLEQSDFFAGAIERVATYTPEERAAASAAARARAAHHLASGDANARNRAMIYDALGHAVC